MPNVSNVKSKFFEPQGVSAALVSASASATTLVIADGGPYGNLTETITLTSSADNSGSTFVIVGTDGNGDAQTPKSGKFIYLGFRPQYFLIKNITQTEAWNQWDDAREPNFNLLSKKLSLNTSDAEYTSNVTTYAIDFVSNGVKLRTNYSAVNDNLDYFFYAAFAEWPYKYTRAR